MYTDRSSINQTNKPPSTHVKPNLFSRDEAIQNKVIQLDMTNKKLLSIANSIMATSFIEMGSTNRFQVPKILQDFEFQIRTVLQQMISSIKQYFVDIDSKLKSLCNIIQQKYVDSPIKNPQIREKACHSFHNPLQQFSLRTLTEKVSNLQMSLRKTQQNQKKLVEIIEGIIQKHNIQEQPTLLKNDKSLRDFFQYKKAKVSLQNEIQINQILNNQSRNVKTEKNNNNLSLLHIEKTPNLPSKPSQIFSIHEKLSGLIESDVTEGQNHQETGIYLKRVFARVHNNNQILQFSNPVKKPKSSHSLNNKFQNFASINLNKKSLKPPNYANNTSENERKPRSPQKILRQNNYQTYNRESDIYIPRTRYNINFNRHTQQNKSQNLQEQHTRRFNFLIENLNEQAIVISEPAF